MLINAAIPYAHPSGYEPDNELGLSIADYHQLIEDRNRHRLIEGRRHRPSQFMIRHYESDIESSQPSESGYLADVEDNADDSTVDSDLIGHLYVDHPEDDSSDDDSESSSDWDSSYSSSFGRRSFADDNDNNNASPDDSDDRSSSSDDSSSDDEYDYCVDDIALKHEALISDAMERLALEETPERRQKIKAYLFREELTERNSEAEREISPDRRNESVRRWQESSASSDEECGWWWCCGGA